MNENDLKLIFEKRDERIDALRDHVIQCFEDVGAINETVIDELRRLTSRMKRIEEKLIAMRNERDEDKEQIELSVSRLYERVYDVENDIDGMMKK